MEAIEGKIDDAFTKGALGLRLYSDDDLKAPLKHVTETRFVSDEQQIHNGYVVMVEEGKNLIFQVGYNSSTTNFGFGLRINRFDEEKLVEAIYFPNTGAAKKTWIFGTIDVDDEGNQFLVKSLDDLKIEYGSYVAFNQLTFTIWPITGWKHLDDSFGNTGSPNLQNRSAKIVGVDRGDHKGLGLDMRYARIVAEDFEKRQDLTVTFLSGTVQAIKENTNG